MLLTPDQFDIAVRGFGMGVAQSVGRIGATIGPFLIGALMILGFTISMIFMVFVGVLIVGIVVVWFGLTDQDR